MPYAAGVGIQGEFGGIQRAASAAAASLSLGGVHGGLDGGQAASQGICLALEVGQTVVDGKHGGAH